MPRKTPFKTEIGQRIKKIRKELHLTQEELAKKIGFGATTITNYESGYSEPDLETLVKISKISNCTTDYLLGLKE